MKSRNVSSWRPLRHPLSIPLTAVIASVGSLEVSVFEVPVLEGEAFLLALAPFLVVKVNVCSLRRERSSWSGTSPAAVPSMLWERWERAGADLLKLVRDGFGLFMSLEPHHVLGVEPPGLLLQGFGCQILGLGALRRGSRNM